MYTTLLTKWIADAWHEQFEESNWRFYAQARKLLFGQLTRK